MSKIEIENQLKAFVTKNANHKVYFELYSSSDNTQAGAFLGKEFSSAGPQRILQNARKAPNPDDNFIHGYAFDVEKGVVPGTQRKKNSNKVVDTIVIPTKGITEVEVTATAAKAEAAEAPAEETAEPVAADAAPEAEA